MTASGSERLRKGDKFKKNIGNTFRMDTILSKNVRWIDE